MITTTITAIASALASAPTTTTSPLLLLLFRSNAEIISNDVCYFHFHSLQKMRNAGLMSRLRARTLPGRVLPQYRDWATIGLAEVAPTVSIFVLGALVSVLILAVERSIAVLEAQNGVKMVLAPQL
jgi:hypothetical protein